MLCLLVPEINFELPGNPAWLVAWWPDARLSKNYLFQIAGIHDYSYVTVYVAVCWPSHLTCVKE